MRKIIYLLLIIFAASCATMPTQQEINDADYGAYPNNYQETIKNYMAEMLFDPYTAVYSNWRGLSKGWYGELNKFHFGYRVCVNINAKNRMGGYVGNKTYFFIINDDMVIYELENHYCNFK